MSVDFYVTDECHFWINSMLESDPPNPFFVFEWCTIAKRLMISNGDNVNKFDYLLVLYNARNQYCAEYYFVY